MPRPRRCTPAGEIFHVVNRGNDKRVIFADDQDYQRFADLLDRGRDRAAITIVAFCLMRTHFHLVLRPGSDDAVPTYMHWVTSSYACYVREVTNTVGDGHVFQRRYWAKGMRNHLHLLTVLGYVEGNALEAGAVDRAEDWRWGSLYERCAKSRRLIDPDVVHLPPDWVGCVNLPRSRKFQGLLSRLLWFPQPSR
jgi:putative transposase